MTDRQYPGKLITMEQPTRQLSNSELGRVIGLSPSGASYVRSGQRLPSPRVQRALVEQLGADWDTVNAAMIKAYAGDRSEFASLMKHLTAVPEGTPAGQG